MSGFDPWAYAQMAARRHGVDPDLVRRVMRTESGGQLDAVSPKGAIGPMQLMPDTARDLGVDPHDPAQNIEGGVRYLKSQLDTFGRPDLALAAYNAGPGAVRKYGGVPPYAETQSYVRRVGGERQAQPSGQFDGAEIFGMSPGSSGGADLSRISDADLMAMYRQGGGEPTAGSADLSRLSDEELLAMYRGGAPASGTGGQFDGSDIFAPPGAAGASAGNGSVIDAKTGDALTREQTRFYQGYKVDRNAAPGSKAFPLGQRRAEDVPDAGQWYVTLDGTLKQAPGSMGQDAWDGVRQPWERLVSGLQSDFQRSANAEIPRSPQQFVKQTMDDLSAAPRVVGDLLGVAGAPLQALIRPAVRQFNKANPLPAYTSPGVRFAGGRLQFNAPRKMTEAQEMEANVATVNNALSAGRPAGFSMSGAMGPSNLPRVAGRNLTEQVRAVAPQMPVPVNPGKVSIGQLQADKAAAYRRVESLGASYTAKAKQGLLQRLERTLGADGIDPGANPGAWSALQRAKTVLGGKGSVSLTDLDNLRQTAWRQAAGLRGPDKAAERFYGQKIIDHIDDFVDNAQLGQMKAANPQEVAAAINKARELNRRYRKAQVVSNEIESAGLRAASTYAGGNKANAIRQELRPLIDPTSNSRLRGLTPKEAKAIKGVVKGRLRRTPCG